MFRVEYKAGGKWFEAYRGPSKETAEMHFTYHQAWSEAVIMSHVRGR